MNEYIAVQTNNLLRRWIILARQQISRLMMDLCVMWMIGEMLLEGETGEIA